jgi:hypothetical protein
MEITQKGKDTPSSPEEKTTSLLVALPECSIVFFLRREHC